MRIMQISLPTEIIMGTANICDGKCGVIVLDVPLDHVGIEATSTYDGSPFTDNDHIAIKQPYH